MVDNVELLLNGVVVQAADDYRKALCKLKALTDEIEELEDFFTGKRIKKFTKLDGRKLMKALKEEVIANDYDLKKITESHHKSGVG